MGACGGDRVVSASRSYTLQVVADARQTGPAGSLLERGIGVVVRDAASVAVRGAVVVFRVTKGAASGARVLDSLVVTSDLGEARADLQLGTVADTVEVMAFPYGTPSRAVAMRVVTSGGPTLTGLLPGSVGPGDTLSIAGSLLGGTASVVELGSARLTPVSGSSGDLRVVVPDCLPAGVLNVRVLSGTAWTAARQVLYAPRRRALSLARFQATVIGAAELATCVSLTADAGAQYVLIPQLAVQGTSPVISTVRVTTGPEGIATLFAGSASAVHTAERTSQETWDLGLREVERRLAPLAHDASSYKPPLMALTVGSLRTFHVVADLQGDKSTPATGRLRFLGTHLGIYVDTMTANSFTDVQLDQLGKLFDNDLYRSDVAAFGTESDIDRNGRVLVFMTPRVNALVAAGDCPTKGFVTGFYFGRDLIPRLANSNAGEIFYAMVPDPGGTYSCSHAVADVTRLVPGTFVHEFQHMISFFHHAVARAGDPEEQWLNEGLSHIAEELVSRLFEQRYPAPLGRSTFTQLFPDSASPFISPQMLNAYIYLANTSAHSVTTYQAGGSIEERGASWLFLRWLGDQKGEGIYQRLVQTSQTGVANVEARAGEPFSRLFGDFSIAIYADSLPNVSRSNVAPRYRFLSRNLRQLMARQAIISGFSSAFPIGTVAVPVSGYSEGPIIPGTMVYGVLGPFFAGQAPIVLDYFKTGGARFAPSEGAQLGVLRIR